MGFDVSLRIAGEAGQGIQTIGEVLCRIFCLQGLRLRSTLDYMSRVRGGNNYYQIRISQDQPLSFREKVDFLVPLNPESVELHQPAVAESGVILLDKKYTDAQGGDARFVDVPFRDIALASGGKAAYASSVVVGAVAGMLGIGREVMARALQAEFSSKGADVVQRNIACSEAGLNAVRAFSHISTQEIDSSGAARYVMDGNEAIALGAAYAGCRFYSGYPMTPSTTIMETFAGFAAKTPLVVEQAEDELAAINMAVGASFAGTRAMTATSGGGFALMTEGLSLAAMIETPVVVVNAMRPAPATGFPTRTEQADLNLVINAGHGEFARVVYAPGNISEAFDLTVRAFDVADRFQIPAIVLTDQFLADTVCAVDRFSTAGLQRKRHIMPRSDSRVDGGYRRFLLTESGISPRAVPSWSADPVYADSDEHTEEGHITEDAATRTEMVNKRFLKRMELLRNEVLSPVATGVKGATLILLGFGSTRETIEEVCAALAGSGVGCIHFPQVWPFPAAPLEALVSQGADARLVTVENNAGGQLARLIKSETSLCVHGSILKYNGRPFAFEELLARVGRLGGSHV